MADALPARPQPPLPIAISDCLLGSEVRYDGTASRASFPHTLLDGLFEFRGICPEVGIGLGVPREPIRMVGRVANPRVVGVVDPARDVTEALTEFGTATAARLGDVAGYVFMKNSPSCGLFRVKVYPLEGSAVRGAADARGRGAHAAGVVAALPDLPVEENGRLHDPVLRQNFVTRAFAYAHWRACFGDPEHVTAQRLVAFHDRYQSLLMAHSAAHHRQAGRLLSDSHGELAAKAGAYVSLLMAGLALPATAESHAIVLSHLQREVEQQLDGSSRQALEALISGYRRGEQPLRAPLTWLERHLRQNPDAYARHQSYLDPHPGIRGVS